MTAGRLRVLLAVLAMSAGRSVPVDRLAAAIWSEHLPDNPRRSLQTYVTRLRTVLGSSLIETRPDGYLLRVPSDAVDVTRFARLLDEADRTADDQHRRALLIEALEMWRGDPFEDLRSPWLSTIEGPPLIERYLAAVEQRIDLDLAAGRHDGLAAELRELTETHPLRESLWVRLLAALAHAGRPAEALAGYGSIRTRLADELGTEPSVELRRIHADLLAGRVPLSRHRAQPPVVPRQLPAAPRDFTGRAREVADLARLGDQAAPVAAIDGMAGVGKTALALHVGHRMADRFPDGQLFIDLHGHTPNVPPVRPEQAIAMMLRALGVPDKEHPVTQEEQAALFRSLMAGRRMIVILDDAAGAEQVRPLLPGGGGCLVLITGRRRLTGLDSAHTMSLSLLSPGDAMALFRRSVGESRLATTPSRDQFTIVKLCGRLPLAIRIAAARLRAHPAWSPADLAERLASEDHRLAELQVGRRSVAAAFDASYRNLPDDTPEAHRLLGQHPGRNFDAGAAAALVNAPAAAARRLVDDLLDAHVVQEPSVGRYEFHDLVRMHAAAAGDDGPADRRRALGRLIDHYTLSATAAAGVASPHVRTPGRLPTPRRSSARPPLPRRGSTPRCRICWRPHGTPVTMAAASTPCCCPTSWRATCSCGADTKKRSCCTASRWPRHRRRRIGPPNCARFWPSAPCIGGRTGIRPPSKRSGKRSCWPVRSASGPPRWRRSSASDTCTARSVGSGQRPITTTGRCCWPGRSKTGVGESKP